MEQNQLELNNMSVGNKYSLTSDIMRDMQHSMHFQQAFERSFLSFVDVMGALLFQMTPEARETLKTMYSLNILIKHAPDEFVSGLMLKEFSESKRKDEYLALFQNAFIYAVASCYKSQIEKTYMLASEKATRTEAQNTEYMMTSKINGSYLVGSPDDRAQHSDTEYSEYVATTHPLFAKFVQSKHRFQYKKILAVAGYLISPQLGKE